MRKEEESIMKNRKGMALLMAVAVGTTTLAGCASGAEKTAQEEAKVALTEENTADESQLMNTMAAVSTVGAAMAQKEETVYVKTNASGGVDSIVVSDWLKNRDQSDALRDRTELKDITNLKGKQQYAEDGEDLVWQAAGDDIFYQGISEKALPVDVRISYELDGTPIKPEELAGKNGHVKIKMNYVNQESKKVDINGTVETIYTPFAVMSGMILDHQKFNNVAVTNGTVISDGNKDIVVGMAFPGLVESLNGGKPADNEMLDRIEESVRIPSEVVVEADADDFELGMTLTMVSSDVMGALGLERLDSGSYFDDLGNSMEEFRNAGSDLRSGTGQVRDGAEQLADGSNELVSGSGDLYDGVKRYTDGVNSLNNGAQQLMDGAARLNDGAGSLQTGISRLDAGVGSLSDGISNASAGADKVQAGASELSSGADALAVGATQVSAGVNALAGKLNGMGASLGSAASGAQSISDGISGLNASVSSPKSIEEFSNIEITVDSVGSDAVYSALSANLSADAFGIDAETMDAILRAAAGVGAGVANSAASEAATQAARGAACQAANGVLEQISGVLNTPGANGASLVTGSAGLAQGLNAALSELTSAETTGQIQALAKGAGDLANGASNLRDGAKKLSGGMNDLTDGMHKLQSGALDLKSGTTQLTSGAATLKNGIGDLKNGTGTLADGTKELNSNSGQLLDGSRWLNDGAVTLADGMNELYQGALALDDGMIRFDEEGIRKLTDLFDTDYNNMEARIRAISNAGKAYKTFSGSGSEEEGSVRFVIESAAIKN